MLSLIRTLHVYLTMAGAGLLLFMGTTGFLLNHPDWFESEERQSRLPDLTIAADLLKGPDLFGIDRQLRRAMGEIGLADPPGIEDDSVLLVYRKPGARLDVTINRQTGQAESVSRMRGPAGVLGDLHRAKSSGRGWKLLLDAAAILLLLAVLSGIVMCVTSRVRRRLGVIAMVGGAAVCAVVYLLLVP